MRNRLLRVIPLLTLVAAAGLLLTACPPPITPDLANVVQDTVAPVVTITAPGDNTSFRSELSVTGTVTDASRQADDGRGVIQSIAFTVSGAEYLSRTLLISDGTVTYDPPELPFTSYDPDTGAFEITFSTIDPTLLTGFRQITVTATDEKGHVSEQSLTVYAYTDGPHVELTAPQDGDRYASVVRIAGTVTDSATSDLTSEIDPDGLRYRIGADIVQIAEFDNPATGEFYDPATGEFVIDHVFNPLPTGGVTLEVTATDLAGYEGTATRSLVDQARSGLVFTSPGADTAGTYYYSSDVSTGAEATVTVAGSPLEPGEIDSIVWDTVGGLITAETDSAYGTGQPSFSFPVDLSSATSGAGDVSIRIRSFDNQGRLSPYTFIMIDDPTAPALDGGSPPALGPANTYVDLTFTEGVWGNLNQATPVTAANFTATASGALVATLGTPTRTDGSALSGGETAIRIPMTISNGEPDTGDTVDIDPSGTPPRDRANNPWTGSASAIALLDQKAPTVSSISVGTVTGALSANGNQYVNAGDVVDITVTFSEAVTVTGAPTLALDFNQDGLADGPVATYQSGSGTSALLFRYTVVTENTAAATFLDYAAGSLGMTGATVLDSSFNDLVPTLPAPGSIAATDKIVVDTDAPTGTATFASLAATGGNQVAGYINGTNDNLAASATGVTTLITDTNLIGGRIELLMGGVSFVPEASGIIAGDTVGFNLLGSPGTAALQAAVAAGAHSFSLRSYDAAGNVGTSFGSISLTSDYLDPPEAGSVAAVADGGAPAGYANLASTLVNVTASVATGGATDWTAQVLVSGSPAGPVQAIPGGGAIDIDVPIAEVPAGTQSFTVRVTKPSGNYIDSTIPDSLEVDKTNPPLASSVIAVADGGAPSGYANQNSTLVNVTASVATGGATDWTAQVLIGGSPVGSPQAIPGGGSIDINVPIASVPEGNQTFTVRVTKPSGNLSNSTSSDSIIADYTAPGQPTGISGKGLGNNEVVGYLNDSANNNLEITLTGVPISGAVGGNGAVGGYAELYVAPPGSGSSATGIFSGTIDGTGTVVFNYLASGNVSNIQTAFPENALPHVLTVVLTDAAGNTGSESTASGNVIADYTDALSVVTAHSLDSDHDGKSETLEIQFNEPVRDTLADPTVWRMQTNGGGTDGYFATFSTAVSSITNANVVNDEYISMSITTVPSDYDTGTMEIRYGGAGITDLAGNPFGGITSWTDVTDQAPAVLLLATIETDPTGDGLFNENNDEFWMTFSEALDGSNMGSWVQADLEAFFYFTGATSDVDTNFNANVAASLQSAAVLKLKQTAAGLPSATTILTGSTIAVATATRAGGATFFGLDGLPVYANTGTTASFSVVGSAGTSAGGGVAITSVPGGSGPGSGGSPETVLVLPDNWPSADRSDRSVAASADAPVEGAPYVAPAVERMRQSQAAASEPVRTAATPRVAPAPQVIDNDPPKVAAASAKSSGPNRTASGPVTTGVSEARGLTANAAPQVAANVARDGVAQSVPPVPATASTAVTAGAGEARAVEPGRSGLAILAMIAALVILAGVALMVLARFGRGGTVPNDGNGESRAE